MSMSSLKNLLLELGIAIMIAIGLITNTASFVKTESMQNAQSYFKQMLSNSRLGSVRTPVDGRDNVALKDFTDKAQKLKKM